MDQKIANLNDVLVNIIGYSGKIAKNIMDWSVNANVIINIIISNCGRFI
jgi:hypothetical protein